MLTEDVETWRHRTKVVVIDGVVCCSRIVEGPVGKPLTDVGVVGRHSLLRNRFLLLGVDPMQLGRAVG
jgi:hypothetical protein